MQKKIMENNLMKNNSMLDFEISCLNNQDLLPINTDEIEKKTGQILDYILNSSILSQTILNNVNLSGKSLIIDVMLTSDKGISELNNEYRGKNKPTDVLSFALAADDENNESLNREEILLGEIVISLETAKKQADEREASLEEETEFLLCHGILHLLGINHPNEDSLSKILSIQSEILDFIKTNED